MREIIEALMEISGEYVEIYTEHKLFGKQHVQMEFAPETEIGLGFRCKGQAIYIDKNDVIDYYVGDKEIGIKGTMMCIKIRIVK